MLKNFDFTKDDLKEIPMTEFSELLLPENPAALAAMKKTTPARIGVGRAGARYRTMSYLRFLADQQSAASAVFAEVTEETVKELHLFEVQTKCRDKYEMLTRPDLGRLFEEEAVKTLKDRCVYAPDVQIYVGDGLCAPSVKANIPDLLTPIKDNLTYLGYSVGTPFFVRYCCVNTARAVSELLKPKVTVVLIGERPGMLTSESMSAYMAYGASYGMSESDYTVVSNISRSGMPPVEASAYITDIIKAMLEQKTSGYKLQL